MEKDLALFHFIENEAAVGTVHDWIHHIDILTDSAEKHLGLSSVAAAASLFMRRYGLYMTGHFYLFNKYRRIWDGCLDDIEIVVGRDESWPLFFQLPNDKFIPCGDEGAALILDRFVNPVIESLLKNAKLPAVISRENLFGYVLWMYVHILEDTKDLQLFNGYEMFLQKKEPLEAMKDYSRLTCCLYKEVPGCKKCPYCPMVKGGSCEVIQDKVIQ